MRKAEFFVPADAIVEFADALTQSNLSNSITGTSEDDEVIIEVEYYPNDEQKICDLEDYLEKLIEEGEEEEEDDDDDDYDED